MDFEEDWRGYGGAATAHPETGFQEVHQEAQGAKESGLLAWVRGEPILVVVYGQ